MGFWLDAIIYLPRAIDETSTDEYYKTEVTVFIAKGTNPDSGLDGTLSVSILPDTETYKSVSLLA